MRLLLFAALLALSGCDFPTGPSEVADIQLDRSAVELMEGHVDTLSATVLDARGREVAGVALAWSSSDTTVAAVDASGVVTARSPGAARVTASAPGKDGAPVTAGAMVTVGPAPARVEWVEGPSTGLAGTVLHPPIRFRVLDDRGAGVPGIRVEFVLVSGGGSLSDSAAVTDSLGYAGVVLTWGTGPGRTQIDAHVREAGIFGQFFGHARAPLTLEPDSLLFPAPGCRFRTIFARMRYPNGEEVLAKTAKFEVSDTSVVGLTYPRWWGTHGYLYGGQTQEVRPLRTGTVRLVATFEGVADTALVTVGPDQGERVVFESATSSPKPMAVGDTTRLGARVENACGDPVAGAQATFRSLDEAVVGVTPSGEATVRDAGAARVVAEWEGLADTLHVEAKHVRVTPLDTTVFVGDTVRYRAFSAGSSGVYEPELVHGISTTNTAVAGPLNREGRVVEAIVLEPTTAPPPVLTQAEGTVTIKLWVWGGLRPATLRVVPRP